MLNVKRSEIPLCGKMLAPIQSGKSCSAGEKLCFTFIALFKGCLVSIKVYDLLGRVVATLINEEKPKVLRVSIQ